MKLSRSIPIFLMLVTISSMIVIESPANAKPHKIKTMWDIVKFNPNSTHPLNNYDVQRIKKP